MSRFTGSTMLRTRSGRGNHRHGVMVSIYNIKPAFQRLLRPMTRWLAGIGVTANHVTVTAMALSFASGGAIVWDPGAKWPLLLLPPALLLRMALNAIDGMLAREHGMKTKKGALLNELGDVISDTVLYLPLGLVPAAPAQLIALNVLLGVIAEMTGVLSIQIGAHRRYDGPMGKSDRAFAFGLIGLILGLGVPAGTWLNILLTFMLLLSVYTILNRARRALAESS